MVPTEVAYFATPAPMTATDGVHDTAFAGLGTDPVEVCGVASGLMVHEFLAGHYGVDIPPEHRHEIEHRSVSELVTGILARDPRPVVERWDPETRRWIRADPQIDDVQRRLLRIDFDPLDLPPGPFLTGGEAWRRCRAGDDDPQRFGIDDLAAIRSLYDTDDLRIEGPVVSGRTHQRVDLPLAMTPTRQAS